MTRGSSRISSVLYASVCGYATSRRVAVGAHEGADPAVAAEDEERKAFAVVRAGLPEREQGEAGGGTAGRSAADDDQVGAVGST